jgi:hypothetical protein
MLILKLALLILSFENQNRFTIIGAGVGYLGISEKPGFTISELTVGEFQDFRLIPDAGPISFALMVGGAKLFPSLLLDREDRTFEFIRSLRYMPGGGILPFSFFIYSKRAIFRVLETQGGSSLLVPFLRFQIIPISDTLFINIFNPALFTKRVENTGPFPHFEVSSGVRGVSGSFIFDFKFGLRTFSLFVPTLTQSELEAIKKYEQQGKKFVGKEYPAKYGLLFFFNIILGIDIPSYYITRVVTVEEGKAKEIVSSSQELEKKIAELEKKLAELESERAKLLAKQKEEIPAEQPKTPPPKEVASIEKKEEVPPLSLGSDVIKINSYSEGNLYLSWNIPASIDSEDIVLQRCLGYNCENFSDISSFPSSTTSYSDQIVENQIYCYRLVVFLKYKVKGLAEEAKKKLGKESITSGKVCAYVSHKKEIIRVYF